MGLQCSCGELTYCTHEVVRFLSCSAGGKEKWPVELRKDRYKTVDLTLAAVVLNLRACRVMLRAREKNFERFTDLLVHCWHLTSKAQAQVRPAWDHRLVQSERVAGVAVQACRAHAVDLRCSVDETHHAPPLQRVEPMLEVRPPGLDARKVERNVPAQCREVVEGDDIDPPQGMTTRIVAHVPGLSKILGCFQALMPERCARGHVSYRAVER